MVRCPQCGKKLDQDDVLVPIFDKTGRKLIDCFHIKKATFDRFKEVAEKQGLNPGDVFFRLISDYMTQQDKSESERL